MVKFHCWVTESICFSGLQSMLLIKRKCFLNLQWALTVKDSKEKIRFSSVRDENFRFITSCKIARAWGKQNRACIYFTAAKIIAMTICGVISNGLHFVSISLCDVRAKIIYSKWEKKYLFWSICGLDLWCPPRHSPKNWLICERSWFAGKVLCL